VNLMMDVILSTGIGISTEQRVSLQLGGNPQLFADHHCDVTFANCNCSNKVEMKIAVGQLAMLTSEKLH